METYRGESWMLEISPGHIKAGYSIDQQGETQIIMHDSWANSEIHKLICLARLSGAEWENNM